MAEPLVTLAETGEIGAVELAARRDRECARWYSEGGEKCVALTKQGLLLEPVPTFAPRLYRLIACGLTLAEGERLAVAQGYVHLRRLRTARLS
jgi:hypothetical protein